MRSIDILGSTPLVDGHNDLPWALRTWDGTPPDLEKGEGRLHTDLPRLRAGKVGAQFWSVYVPGSFTGAAATQAVREQIDLVRKLVDDHPDTLRLATTADEAQAAFSSGYIGSLLGAEGGHCIANSLDVLRDLRERGVRYLTLTHNLNNEWADSATDQPKHGGLSDFGFAVVREMNQIGMIVDLSHVATSTMRDALSATVAPVLFTHSSARAVTDHPRNVPDEILAQLPGNGGVCMVTFVPAFVSTGVSRWAAELAAAMVECGRDPRDLDDRAVFAASWNGPPRPKATIEDVVAHLEHVREVCGVDHLGLGGDYDGTGELPEGLEDVSKYPVLFDALLARLWSTEDCEKLAGRNVLRVLRAADEIGRQA